MGETELGDTLTELRTLRTQVQTTFQIIDTLADAVAQVERRVAAAHAALNDVDRLLPALQAALPSNIAQLEDSGRVLHRDLSHLEGIVGGAEEYAPRELLLLTSSILQGSVRLAAAVLPPQRLAAGNTLLRDILGVRWQAWLDELLTYLSQVLPLVIAGAALPGEQYIAEQYQTRLAALASLLEDAAQTWRVAATAQQADQPLRSAEIDAQPTDSRPEPGSAATQEVEP